MLIKDLTSDSWQVALYTVDKEKTAFSAGNGLYLFQVMTFGLYNAPAIFGRLMELVLRGLTGTTGFVYLDNIIVSGRNFEEVSEYGVNTDLSKG